MDYGIIMYISIFIIVIVIIYLIYNSYTYNSIESFTQSTDLFFLSNQDLQSIFNNLDNTLKTELYETFTILLKIWNLYSSNYSKMVYLINSIDTSNPGLFDKIDKTGYEINDFFNGKLDNYLNSINKIKIELDDEQKGLLYSLITVLSEMAIYIREFVMLYTQRELRIDVDQNFINNISIVFLNYVYEKKMINKFTDKLEDITMFNQVNFPLKLDTMTQSQYNLMYQIYQRIFGKYLQIQLNNTTDFLTFLSIYEVNNGIIEKTILEFNKTISELNNKIFELENSPQNQLTSELQYMENYNQNKKILSRINKLNNKIDNVENTLSSSYGEEKCDKYVNNLLSEKWKKKLQ